MQQLIDFVIPWVDGDEFDAIFETAKREISNAFEIILPEKSEFEV